MRSSLKLLTALALAATLLAGCKGGKEEDHSLDEFSATVGLGIYKDGNPVFTFLKNTHQYYCNPRKGILRISDNEGTKDVTVKLSAMPSSSSGVDGTVSGNMGVAGFSFSGLQVVRTDSRTVWLWSDKDKVGFILPSAGMTTKSD